MSDAIDITPSHRRIILDLLSRHLPHVTIWVYGSRVTWRSRAQSDPDMVVFTTSAEQQQVFDLKEAFEESDLSFRVDLFSWSELPERFRENIENERVILQRSRIFKKP